MMPSARPRWNAILCMMNGWGRRPRPGGVAPATSATFSCKQAALQDALYSSIQSTVAYNDCA